jgi:hypothetical protein
MLRFVAVPYIPRLRGGEPTGGDGHLNPHHGREHEHQHPLRRVPLDGRHTGEDRHGILQVAYIVTKSYQEFHQRERNAQDQTISLTEN